jgi:hypothetical protein
MVVLSGLKVPLLSIASIQRFERWLLDATLLRPDRASGSIGAGLPSDRVASDSAAKIVSCRYWPSIARFGI